MFAIEIVGGVLLITGLYTRVVALALALVPVLAGAFFVHWPNGWVFTAPNGGWEYVAFLMASLVAQSLFGDGAFAASSLWRREPAPDDSLPRATRRTIA